MNNNFIKNTRSGKNIVLSSIITAIVDFIVYIGTFGIEYFMGKVLDKFGLVSHYVIFLWNYLNRLGLCNSC